MKFQFVVLSLSLAFFIGCSLTPTSESPTQRGYEELSLEELQQSLGVELQDLGFVSKTFNSCSLPKPLREDKSCGNRHFSMIHFRVQCRNSEGTTENSVTALDLKALHKELEWVVGPYRGVTFTDSDGYGQVRVISTKPIHHQRFVLKSGKIALGLTAEEVSRIVVPSNWCN